MKLAKLILASAACLLPFAASAAEPVTGFIGSRTVVNEGHMVPHLGKDEGYGEKYTFNGNFGARGTFYFSMTISNLGMGDHKMESKGRLTIDGKSFKWKKKLDDDEWSHTKSPFSITAGPAVLSGDPDNLVMTAKDGADSIKFTFTPIGRAWRPRNGQVQFGKERKAVDFTVFPLMKVTGTATIGGETIAIEGTGFGSHSWADLAVYEQATMTREFRGIVGDKTIYMREMLTPPEYGSKLIHYVLVTKGKANLIESYKFVTAPTETLTDTQHENRYQVEESFTIQGFDAEGDTRQFRGKITKKKLRKREDMLKKMGAAVRMVASRYSKPVRYDYDADFHIQVKTPEGVEDLKGTGRYEVYHWNK